MKKDYVSWGDVRQYIDKLSTMLSFKPFTGVYGIPRGGCVLAVMLSYKMNIPLLAAPCNGCIIIDDIADTGKTLLHYKEKSGCFVTTMYFHRQSLVVPNFWYKEKKDNWIVYPWEEEEHESIRYNML